MKLRHLMLAAMLAVPGVAWSSQCSDSIAEANTVLANGSSDGVSPESFEEARGLVALATEQLGAGNEDACMETMDKARELLGLSE